ASVDLADALVRRKDYVAARGELGILLPRCEKMNLRLLQARTHYLLSIVLSNTGQGSEADRNLAEARQIMDEIRKEARTDDFLKRADLKPLMESAQTASKR